MSIATKNGSVILKSGSVAENCGCCGDWYCYNQCADFYCPPSSAVTVSLTAADFLLNFIDKFTPYSAWLAPYWIKNTRYFRGSEITGTHSLVYNAAASTQSQTLWETQSSFWAGCPYGGSEQMASPKIRLTLNRTWPLRWDLFIPLIAFSWRSEYLYTEPAASGFRAAGDFSCSSPCDSCFVVSGDSFLNATCNTTTGAVSLMLGYVTEVASLPVSSAVLFPGGGSSSDYARNTVYSSMPLLQDQQLPPALVTINSVMFGS